MMDVNTPCIRRLTLRYDYLLKITPNPIDQEPYYMADKLVPCFKWQHSFSIYRPQCKMHV